MVGCTWRWYDIYTVCCGTIICLIQLSCGIFHCIRVKNSSSRNQIVSNSHTNAAKMNRLVSISTHCALVLYILRSIVYTWNGGVPPSLFATNVDLYCDILTRTGYFMHVLSKSSLYLMLLIRIRLIYADTKYAYSTYTIYPLYAILLSILSVSFYASFFDIESSYNSNKEWCHTKLPTFEVIVVAVFDFILSLACIILLFKPLHTITRAELQQKIENASAKYIVRSGIVTIVAIVSSLISVVFRLRLKLSDPVEDTIFLTVVLVDNLINTICIILFDNLNGKLYQKLCCVFVESKNNTTAQNNNNTTKNNNNDTNTNNINMPNETKMVSNPLFKTKSRNTNTSETELESKLSDLIKGAALDADSLQRSRMRLTTSIALSTTADTIRRYIYLIYAYLCTHILRRIDGVMSVSCQVCVGCMLPPYWLFFMHMQYCLQLLA